jgi:beta-xylosidase
MRSVTLLTLPAALLSLFALGCPGADSTGLTLTYENPLWDGYLADPFVFKVKDVYYACGTGSAPDGREFPILRSSDFTHWEFVNGALERTENPKIKDYWAPEIAEREGKFYLYYAGDMKMRVAVSDQPTGPFKDTGKLMFPDLPFSIDGHAFHDPKSGKWYLYYAKDIFDQRPGTALAMVRLADDMITPVGPETTVLRAFADWQIYERNRPLYGKTWDAWYTIEGPAVIFRDNRYYCFYSGGNWKTPGYGVGCAVANDLLGPYIDKQSREAASVIKSIPGKLLGPGHNSVILGPDTETWFNVYHSWNPERTKRQICMDPIAWTDEGPQTYKPSRGRKQVILPLSP